MSQLNLVDLLAGPPLSRNTDPVTSHQAADRHVNSGRQARDKQTVHNLIHDNPGLTATELGALLVRRETDLFADTHQHLTVPQAFALFVTEVNTKTLYDLPNKRCSDLERDGSIVVAGERACTVTGRNARTWTTNKGLTP